MNSLNKLMTSGIFAHAVVFAAKASAQNQGTTLQQGLSDDSLTAVQPAGVYTDLASAIQDITNYILGFMALVALILFVYGGVLYLTAAGSDDQVGKAKKIIVTAITGLVIIALAYAVVLLVIQVLTAPTT